MHSILRLPPPSFHQASSLDPNITTNQNYNKILERDWLSPARFSAILRTKTTKKVQAMYDEFLSQILSHFLLPGNRNSSRPIPFEIILVINKSDSRFAVVRF